MAGEILNLEGGSVESLGEGQVKVVLPGDFEGIGLSVEDALRSAIGKKYPQPPQPTKEVKSEQWHK